MENYNTDEGYLNVNKVILSNRINIEDNNRNTIDEKNNRNTIDKKELDLEMV